MAQITVSEQLYQALVSAAQTRGETPEAIIEAGIHALDVLDQQIPAEPFTAEEFATQVLEMTPDDMAQADADARRLYPDVFTMQKQPE